MLMQIALVLLLCWFMVLRWKGRKIRRTALQMTPFNSKSMFPLIGHAHHLTGGGEARMKAIQEFGLHAAKNGGWTPVHLGPTLYGLVADPIEAEHVMRTHLEKDDILKVTRGLIGNGIIFAPVPIWRPRRKILAPTFSQHNLNQFVDVFYQQSAIMVDNVRKEADRGTFSIWNYLTLLTMDSICRTTLGSSIGAQNTSDNQFLLSFQEYARIIASRLCYPWLTNDISFKFLCYFGMHEKMKECLKILKGFVNDIIEHKRVALKEEYNKQKDSERFRPFLELLIEASGGEKGYTNEELQEEVQVIMVAGTDTSAVGTGFITKMLAKHPAVQEKVYSEIKEVYGDSERPVKAEDLSRFSYLEAVIKETLRLYPPVPLTARKIQTESVTPGGIKLTPGMGVLICHWALHRNPKYWGKDVDEFRPERFFDSPPTHPLAFAPFSGGPRNCLGYKYAMMSMMTVTITLLRRYRIVAPDHEQMDKPIRLTFEVMMKDADSFQIKLESRKKVLKAIDRM